MLCHQIDSQDWFGSSPTSLSMDRVSWPFLKRSDEPRGYETWIRGWWPKINPSAPGIRHELRSNPSSYRCHSRTMVNQGCATRRQHGRQVWLQSHLGGSRHPQVDSPAYRLASIWCLSICSEVEDFFIATSYNPSEPLGRCGQRCLWAREIVVSELKSFMAKLWRILAPTYIGKWSVIPQVESLTHADDYA